ncbi:hypothetical protein SHELI_v1c09830 [Spiroplasma helicoides]|uniref:Uncharacterized protein n=1 Tax=Spiroplasma helicoides TaxID=216938 RepID=A0A1B3SLZ6_9MOLU|nr:hypothetical protein [Spiroplasma helicoides]AOG60930.1 hypothetical protein SHELI_v1c09830 [Spiroplasma helicoides]
MSYIKTWDKIRKSKEFITEKLYEATLNNNRIYKINSEEERFFVKTWEVLLIDIDKKVLNNIINNTEDLIEYFMNFCKYLYANYKNEQNDKTKILKEHIFYVIEWLQTNF